MLRRRLVSLLILLSAVLGLSGVLYAQMEAAERGIAPIDSSGTLEVTGIHVDVMGKDGQSARYEGWRIAQRQGFRAYWAKAHNRPVTEAPTVPDSTLDELVSSIVVEREQIGPNRYIADLGILFDRARSAEILGVGGDVRRSAPMIFSCRSWLRRVPRPPSNFAIRGSGRGRSSGLRKARSITSGLRAPESIRCS